MFDKLKIYLKIVCGVGHIFPQISCINSIVDVKINLGIINTSIFGIGRFK